MLPECDNCGRAAELREVLHYGNLCAECLKSFEECETCGALVPSDEIMTVEVCRATRYDPPEFAGICPWCHPEGPEDDGDRKYDFLKDEGLI